MPQAPATWIQKEELQQQRQQWRRDGARVGFVPTMGALHEGHLSLVRQAKQDCEKVVVSIFVNPIQFGPSEDFAQYPRTLAEDTRLLTELGVDGIYLPNTASMYPPGFQTHVTNREMADGLCGASRPGHFDGVLTVVLKLLHQVDPDVAIFGRKDYQQWRLIERMVKDLDMSVEVLGGDIVREADGLAMSSRNRYLSEDERAKAAMLYQGLQAVRASFQAGEASVAALTEGFSQTLAAETPFVIEYAEIRDKEQLKSYEEQADQNAVMLVAARLGKTRLIDNIEFA